MMKEIWKDVKGYEGFYKVSNLGRVWSCIKNKPRKFHKNRHGYMIVDLYKNAIASYKQVHRLIAEAFVPNPNNLEQVNHIDGDKANNMASNLEWVTGAENSLHAIYSLGHTGQYRCRPVKCIETGEVYPSIQEASRQTGCDAVSISRIANHKIIRGYRLHYVHGFSWEFA